jgi:hypothetical protein
MIGKKRTQAELVLEFLDKACSVSKYIPTPADYALAFKVRELKDRPRGERLHKLHGENAELTTASTVNV